MAEPKPEPDAKPVAEPVAKAVAEPTTKPDADIGPHRPLAVEESLTPYTGPVTKGVDTSTLRGKVMCGYQGWFMARGDGYRPGFVHWGGVDRTPPRCTVDFWPDLTEHDDDELYETKYRHRDGSPAHVFSSTVKKTVVRHFRWMKEYGIDGAFIQRFTGCVGNQRDWNYQRTCAVLHHCREGANRHGRSYAVMYDTDFDRRAIDTMTADWKRLVGEMKLMSTPAYMRHRGAPVISLWGYGFGHRKFDAAATEEFFEYLKRPENGGCTIMLGVPNDWASWTDDRMRLLKEYATVISPWNVGRYGSPDGARAHFRKHWPRDIMFCKEYAKDYYAVVFPGFSWTNLQKGRSVLNQTPRLAGRFLWSQIEEIRGYGMDMVYIAMFDEVDEGTAIFKCTNEPPVGRFCTYEGLPPDHYLKIAGAGGRYLRGEDVSFPEATPDPKQMTYRPMSQLEYYKKPGRFDARMVARWKKLLSDVSVQLHQEPYSDWVRDLYDSGAMRIELSTWGDIAKDTAGRPLMVIATGSEGFNEGDAAVADIVARVRAHLRSGGTLLVASSGRYPLFYPGGGKEAAKFGFKLRMVQSPAGSRVTFDPAFSKELAPWTMTKGGGSRLMRKDMYQSAREYRALARVTSPGGEHLGDAVAAVRPGGEFGTGRIVYVAGDLTNHPDRAALLDAILMTLTTSRAR